MESCEDQSDVPWLMLPYPVSPLEYNTRQFFCLSSSSSSSFPFDLPELSNKIYHGLNNPSWLLVINSGCQSSPFLFNPFSRSRIPLPPLPLPTIWKCGIPRYFGTRHTIAPPPPTPESTITYENNKFLGVGFYTAHIHCAVVSSSQEFEVMVIHGWDKQLAFCRPGDDLWTAVVDACGQLYRKISDLAYCNGLFYAVQDGRDLLVCDTRTSPGTAVVLSPLPSLKDGSYKRECYLVGSDAELLLVIRSTSRMRKRVNEFEVFKLVEEVQVMEEEEEKEVGGEGEDDDLFFYHLADITDEEKQQEGKWLKMKDIGDRAIFISKENSFMVSTIGSVNCSSNCIYTFDVHKEKIDFSETSVKLIEYCMQENSRKRTVNCYAATSLWLWEPLWLQPTAFPK